MDRHLTEIVLFKNTPLNDFQNTIHFKSDEDRDNYFLKENHFKKINFDTGFNFVRDRLQIKAPIEYAKCDGVNYCTFISSRDNKRYYAFVMSYQYINEKVTRLNLIIDVVMTFTQGKTLNTLKNIHVIREHLNRSDYIKYLPLLRTNGDILNTTTKAYVQTKLKSFKSYFVVFQSSVDLSKEFGTVDAPKMETSQGNQYDNMTSPVNLYAIHYEYFNGLMKILAPYPWIMQNIQLLMMIPDDFINLEDLVTVKAKEFNYENLKTFKKGGKSLNKELDGINYSINELCNIYGIDHNEEKHLLRTGYTTAEIYSWDGQRILLDNAFLDENTGIKFRAKTSIGYENKIALYPINYKTTEKEKAVKNSKGEILIDKGSFLNDAIIYDNFTELPILIDNYRLSKASNAYSRQLAEDRLPSNRINSTVKDITSGNLLGNMQSGNLQGTQGSFYNAVNLLSDLKPQSVLTKFENEYEFYRNQRAEFADMALKAPTITNQSPGTAFQMANEINGLTIKLSAPSEQEFAKVKKYYKMFGYEIEEDGKQISDIESMTICNFLQIRGNYKIHGVDVALMEQLKAQLENGVRFWHNNNTSNPMEQDIQKNKMR